MAGYYNPSLVALSCVIAAFASYTALDLVDRISSSTRPFIRGCWLVAGAIAMGTGTWAMHFIGMLALVLPIPMGYDTFLTAISLLASTVASGAALWIVNSGTTTKWKVIAGGLTMGGGICIMHYIGMESMKMQPAVYYNLPTLLSSIAIALLAAITAFWVAFSFPPPQEEISLRPLYPPRLFAALVMTVAISGMHYTAMAAMQVPEGAIGVAAGSISPTQLAGVVALVSTCILLATLVVSLNDRYQTKAKRYLANSLHSAQEELQFMLLHDPLTRLPNRQLLEDRIARIMARARRHHSEFAVIYIDLDRFKSVNDLLGHHIGDALIKEAGQRLQSTLRDMDTVARVGGDEFMVVLNEGESTEAVRQVANRIHTSLATAYVIYDHEIRISASIGISVYPRHGQTIHDLMVHADAAMYYAKDVGRNGVQVYEQGMSIAIHRRNKIAANLARALEQGRLTLVYQPIIDLRTGEVTGAEALARWHDEELGRVDPGEFIRIAEDTGLIVPLGEWALIEACSQAKRWQRDGLTQIGTVAVNVSAYQLNHKDFIDLIQHTLENSGLAHHTLDLEITEGAVMQNPERARQILYNLHELGTRISIDDFGTGYSNLAQLKRFPVDNLKIDSSFVAGVTTDNHDAALVKAIVALAGNLDLAVIAEGVETREQQEFLQELGVHRVQGYLYSRPLPPRDFEAFCANALTTRSAPP